MRWKKAKNILQHRPYLLDPYRLRSNVTAKRFLNNNKMPSIVEVLNTARQRSNMDYEEWEAFLGLSHKNVIIKNKRFAQIKIGNLLYISRRAIIVMIILLITTTFMACTSTGRTIVNVVFKTVSEVLEGILYIYPERYNVPTLDNNEVFTIESSITDFSSIDEALEKIDSPVFYLSDRAKLVSINMTSSSIDGTYLESNYRLGSELFITIKQDWNAPLEDSIILDESKDHVRIVLDSGYELEGVYSNDDSGFIGVIITESSLVHFFISGIESTHMLQECTTGLRIG